MVDSRRVNERSDNGPEPEPRGVLAWFTGLLLSLLYRIVEPTE